MADRQREFMMAANHYRAGRITLDEFKKKVLAATAVPGEVALLLLDPLGDSENLKAVKDAIAGIETVGGSVRKMEIAVGDLPGPEWFREKLQSAGAAVVMGLADPASIRLVAKEAGCPVFFVPDEKSDLNNLAAIAQELPASVALMGLGQAASAGKMAASVARP